MVCFGLVPVVGAIGFTYAKLTGNGFFLIGFLIPYVPGSLIACVLGAVFAAKAYRNLPANHKGRRILTAVIFLTAIAVLLCLAFLAYVQNILSRP
jgi:hypothetical protein